MTQFPVLSPVKFKDVAIPDRGGVGVGIREAAIINGSSAFTYVGTHGLYDCIALYIYNSKQQIAACAHLDTDFFLLPKWQEGLSALFNRVRETSDTPLKVTMFGGKDGHSEDAAQQLQAFLQKQGNITLDGEVGGATHRKAALSLEDGSINKNIKTYTLQAWDDGVQLYFRPLPSPPPPRLDLIYDGTDFHRNPPINLGGILGARQSQWSKSQWSR